MTPKIAEAHTYKVSLGGLGRALLRVLFLLAVFLAVTWGLLSVAQSGRQENDFRTFVGAARLAIEGKDPYEVGPMTASTTIGSIDIPALNLNPPILVMLFEPIAGLDPYLTWRVWVVLSVLIYGIAVYVLVRSAQQAQGALPVIWAFGLAGLWHNLIMGQIYAPLLLLAAGAWMSLNSRRYILAGVMIGAVAAIKPTIGLWAVLLLFASCWKAAISAGLTTAAISVLPLAYYGPAVYMSFINTLRGQVVERTLLAGRTSLIGLTTMLGVPSLGGAVAALLVVGVIAWVWRFRPPIHQVSALALALIVALTPAAWSVWMLFLLPIMLTRQWTPLLQAAAVCFLVPIQVVYSWGADSVLSFVTLGSVYGWGTVLVLLHATGGMLRLRHTLRA